MVMREMGEGEVNSVCLITFLFFRLLENIFRNSAECFAITEKISLIPLLLNSQLFLHAFAIFTELDNSVSVFANWTSSKQKNLIFLFFVTEEE